MEYGKFLNILRFWIVSSGYFTGIVKVNLIGVEEFNYTVATIVFIVFISIETMRV